MQKQIEGRSRSKLNSIENKIANALMVNEFSHEDFEMIINEENKISRIKRKHQNDEQ